MENPEKHVWRSAMLVVFGIVLGLIPGGIRLDQMRREVEAERAETQKLNDGLRAGLMNYERELSDEKQKHSTDRADCQNAILGDSGRTVLVDLQHPMTIWVVPRTITPHVVDGIPFSVPDGITLGAAYTHIWPDGRTDGWQRPSRAE
jgi:hypothetical protein